MAFIDPVTGEELQSQAELLRRNRERSEAQRASEIQQRQAQSTDRDSNLRVSTLGKSSARSFMGGGATVYSGEVNPTDFIPNPNADPAKSLPDYYRNGRIVERSRVIDGEIIRTQEYSPIPGLVGERQVPVLSSIRVVDPRKVRANGPTSAVNDDALLVPSYSKYFLEGVSEAHQEKYQVVETFNDWYVYFYGERPPIYRFSGHLLNFHNYNWKNEFMYFYQNFWRGTKCAELGARIFLTYDYQQVQGYILDIQTNVQALTDKAAPFSFSMLVTKRLIFNGTPGDGVIRDNLLPRTESGLINTEASSFSKALTSEFLNGQRPAVSLETQSSDNLSKGIRIMDDTSSSTLRQLIPNPGGINELSTSAFGSQRATFLKNNLGLA